jgi:hypothetical protein
VGRPRSSPPSGVLPSRLFRRARPCVESFWVRRNWPAADFTMIDNGLGFSHFRLRRDEHQSARASLVCDVSRARESWSQRRRPAHRSD